MYRLENKAAAVREVQRYLLIVAQKNEALPHITVDGIYSEQTREAVIIYQELYGLRKSGTVDIITFNSLRDEADLILREKELESTVISHSLFPLKIGSSGTDVANLNNALIELSAYYDIQAPRRGSFYSKETEEAVKKMQRILILEEDGITTVELKARIDKELLSLKNFTLK